MTNRPLSEDLAADFRRLAGDAIVVEVRLPGDRELHLEALRVAAGELARRPGVAGVVFVHDDDTAYFGGAQSPRRFRSLIVRARRLAQARALISGYALLPTRAAGTFFVRIFPQRVGRLVPDDWLAEHALADWVVRPIEPTAERRARQRSRVRPCWPCLTLPSRLEWHWFCAPPAFWRAAQGVAGWVTRCPRCGRHVDRFDEVASLAWLR